MDTKQIITLALVQGLTEFLPISSSAHLILVPEVIGWQDQGLAFDIAVHVGTLLAVVMYYRDDLRGMLNGCVASLKRRSITPASALALYVIVGTIPVGLVGLSMSDNIETYLRSPRVIAAATIGFGLLLWWADKWGRESVASSGLTWKLALLIGVFQALALIPGTSRSGITITAGLLLGFRRGFAAKFSFLLSIPVITLAGLLKVVELMQSTNSVIWSEMLMGILVSAVTAYLSIGWFLKLLQNVGLFPFVLYRFLLGLVLLWVFA